MKKSYIESLFSLEGKVAVITGAAGYFGRAFCHALLEGGAKIVILGRGEKIKEFGDLLKSKYGEKKIDYHMVDFYNTDAYKNCLQKTVKRNRTIDILVNNAFEFSRETGFNDPSGSISSISREQWMRGLEAGIYWYAVSTQVIGDKMKNQRFGSIINISSMYAIVSPDPGLYRGTSIFNPPSYSAAKSAVLAFTRYTASFYGECNVRCNAILPGAFPNLTGNSYNNPKDKEFVKRLEERTVLKRVGNLEDLKGMLIFLASDASSYITGQGIVVDGGWTIK